MRIPINLASQPFRRDRPMIVASLALSAVLCCTLGALIWLAIQDRGRLADVRGEVGRLQERLRQDAAEQAKLDTILRKPENAEVLERSIFLNALLQRKGISWTRIFADLESVLPHNVRVMQIHPTVDASDRLVLDMQFGSEAPAPVADMLSKMGKSSLFGNVDLHSQLPPTQSEPLWRYRVSVNYAQKL